jgi:hypothetical protein
VTQVIELTSAAVAGSPQVWRTHQWIRGFLGDYLELWKSREKGRQDKNRPTSKRWRKWKAFIKEKEIKLHHNKAATAVLCWQLAAGMADIALIQVPWIYGVKQWV